MYGKLVESGSLLQSTDNLIGNASFLQSTYNIESELGSGGSGEVYLAWHKRLCKYVVIKKTACYSGISAQLHRNETEALKNIKCEYLPQVLDFMMENDSSYTVLEYIEGESFDKLLRKMNRVSLPQISKWFLQLASALVAIHKHDVCHRDIKPANIILTREGDVCLIDFNSALVKGNDTGVISLSRAYASPEQYAFFQSCRTAEKRKSTFFAGGDVCHYASKKNKTVIVAESNILYRATAHNVDWKLSDIYSLGATMYHLFSGRTLLEVFRKNTVIPMYGGGSEGVWSVIKRCMNVDPAGRFQSATELADCLQVFNDLF